MRRDYSANNLSRLKRIVLDLLKTETATLAEFGKLSLRGKRKVAAREDAGREAMLRIRRMHDIQVIWPCDNRPEGHRMLTASRR